MAVCVFGFLIIDIVSFLALENIPCESVSREPCLTSNAYPRAEMLALDFRTHSKTKISMLGLASASKLGEIVWADSFPTVKMLTPGFTVDSAFKQGSWSSDELKMPLPLSSRTSGSRSQIINSSEIFEDAIRNKDPDAAKTLVNMRNKREFTYKIWAILIETKVEHLEIDLRNEFRCILVDLAGDKIRTYLRTALQTLEEEPVAILILERRPDLFLERLDGGETSFHLAVSNGEAQVVAMFLDYLLKINRQDFLSPKMGEASHHNQHVNEHSAILEKAAERGHIDVVKMLAEFDPKLLNFGFPLHKAVRGGKFEVVEFLLQEKPQLVEQLTPEPDPRSALFEERNLGREDKTSLEIDKLLVARIIRTRGPGKSPRMIKKLLQGPRGN